MDPVPAGINLNLMFPAGLAHQPMRYVLHKRLQELD